MVFKLMDELLEYNPAVELENAPVSKAGKRSVAFYTLGCKLNFSETSTIARKFNDAGYAINDFEEGADVYVINTCSVTDHADRKTKRVVKEGLKKNPHANVIIIGCYAQLKPEEIISIPGVNLIL